MTAIVKILRCIPKSYQQLCDKCRFYRVHPSTERPRCASYTPVQMATTLDGVIPPPGFQDSDPCRAALKWMIAEGRGVNVTDHGSGVQVGYGDVPPEHRQVIQEIYDEVTRERQRRMGLETVPREK